MKLIVSSARAVTASPLPQPRLAALDISMCEQSCRRTGPRGRKADVGQGYSLERVAVPPIVVLTRLPVYNVNLSLNLTSSPFLLARLLAYFTFYLASR